MSDVSVKFGAQDVGLSQTIANIHASLANLESQTKKASSSIGVSFKQMAVAGAGLALGVGAVKGAFEIAKGTAESFGAALDMGGRLADLSERTGETAGKLLVLERAFTNNGLEAEGVGTSLNKLQKFMAAAGDESSAQGQKLSALGITMADLAGKTPTEQLGVFATRIGEIQDPTERAAMSMEIFGKSGGKMLPILRNFSGELANAKDQLGSMPDIMDKSSKIFDDISDNLTVIKGKFTEFAAGILSRVAPALQYITDAMTKIDAAGLGIRLADAFIGAQTAMDGFTMAMEAVKAGDLSSAFELACASIKLQFKQTANETYRNMIASFVAIRDFLIDVLGPGSGVYTVIKSAFLILADEITLKIGKAILPILASIPGISSSVTDTIKTNISALESGIQNHKNQISNAMEQIGGDIKRAASVFPESFKEAYAKTNPLFDVSKDLLKIKELSSQISADIVFGETESAEATKARAAVHDAINEKKRKELELEGAISKAKADGNIGLKIQLEGQQEYNRALEKAIKLGLSESEAKAQAAAAQANFVKHQQNLTDAKRKDLDLENQIARAKADGNIALQIQLEGQREYNKMLEKALALGMSESDARKQAEDARLSFVKIQENSQEAAHQRQMGRLKEELSISEQLLKDINKAEKDADVTKGGKLTKQAEDAKSSGDFTKAERIAKQIQGREEDQELRGVGASRDRRSVKDIAKSAGLDTFRKSDGDLQKELLDLKRRGGELKPNERGQTEAEAKNGGKGAAESKDSGTLNAIKTAAEAIRTLVQSLDKKLPQSALGI